MASSPITSWRIEGENVEIVTDFIFLGSKETVDANYSHEIKRHFLFGRKATTNLDCVLKSRDITFPMKVYILKAVVFPVVMYGCKLDHKECWVPKNWCFYLGSPLDCKKNKPVNPKGNQPWIFIGRTDAELQYFGHLMWRASWLEKTDAGKDWRQKEKWGVRAWSD